MAASFSYSSGGVPIGATCTLPANSHAGESTRQGLGAVNVTVCFACTASPATSPESLTTPDGTSTATTSANGKCALTAWINSAGIPLAAPSTPVPKTASTTNVAVRISSVILNQR